MTDRSSPKKGGGSGLAKVKRENTASSRVQDRPTKTKLTHRMPPQSVRGGALLADVSQCAERGFEEQRSINFGVSSNEELRRHVALRPARDTQPAFAAPMLGADDSEYILTMRGSGLFGNVWEAEPNNAALRLCHEGVSRKGQPELEH